MGLAGCELTPRERELLPLVGPAGVVLFRRNVSSENQLRALMHSIRSLVPDAIFAADHEGGNVSALAAAIGAPPSALALGIADDPMLTQRVFAETGRRLRDLGVTLLLGPVADVVVTQNPVLSTRAFGTDAAAVTRHVRAALAGLASAGLASCVKHWPGHGRVAVDSHLGAASLDVELDALLTRELPPFAAAIEDATEAIMVAHLSVPAMDSQALATVSPVVVEQWLRERLGFDGLVITDALEMRGFGETPVVSALAAGCDLMLFASPIEAAQPGIEALADSLRQPIHDERHAMARTRITRFVGRPVPPSNLVPDAAVYPEARRQGAVALWFEDSQAVKWPPASADARPRWGLIDAASGDRLLRPPRAEEDLNTALGGATPTTSLLLEALEKHLGAAAVQPVLLPPPGSGSAAQSAPFAPPEGVDGWIVASLRPWDDDEAQAHFAPLLAASCRWIALLGDLSLQTRVPPDVSLLLVPGATVEDAQLLGELLTGQVSLEPRGRWGD